MAGFSVVNGVAMVAGLKVRMLVGLGITDVAVALTYRYGGIGVAISIIAIVFGAGLFALLGVLARKGSKAALIVAMVVYALDGVLLLLLTDWFGAGFHVLALFYFYQGFRAASGRPVEALAEFGSSAEPGATVMPKAVGYAAIGTAGIGAFGLLVLTATSLLPMVAGTADQSMTTLAAVAFLLGLGVVLVVGYIGFRIVSDVNKRDAARAQDATPHLATAPPPPPL